MAIIRFFSLVLIVIALMLLGADVVSTLENGGATIVRSLDQILLLVGVDAKPWLQERLPPLLDTAVVTILYWPGWGVLGLPGTLLALLSAAPRERRPPPPAPPPPPIVR